MQVLQQINSKNNAYKHCKDCKHYIESNVSPFFFSKCSKVQREKDSVAYCAEERMKINSCGQDARYFESEYSNVKTKLLNLFGKLFIIFKKD